MGNGWNLEPHTTAEVGSGYSNYLELLMSRLKVSVEYVGAVWPPEIPSATAWYKYEHTKFDNLKNERVF